MDWPLVHLQIPHYNTSQFIQECIQSCLDLNYPNLSIKVFDDASNDQYTQIRVQINHEKLSFYRNDKNLGRVANYQHAFSHHDNAKWFINLDGDDYYIARNWVKESIEIAEKNPTDNIKHIQANLLLYTDKNNIPIIKSYQNGYCLISGIDYLKRCLKDYSFSHLGSIFNVADVHRKGAYTDDCLHTDFFTAMRVAIAGNVLIGNQNVGVWRESSNNQSSQRYSQEEYLKNETAYYRFFEQCESLLKYNEISDIIKIYELREWKKSLILEYEKNNSILNLLRLIISERSFHFSTIRILISCILLHLNINKSQVNIIHGILTKSIGAALSLILVPILFKTLSPENYGWIGVYTNFVSVIYIFDLGITSLVTKEIVHANTINKTLVFKSLEFVYLTIGFIIAIGILIASPWLSSHWFQSSIGSNISSQSILFWISAAILAQWPHSFYSASLYGLGHQRRSNAMQLIAAISKFLILLMLIFMINSDFHVIDFFIVQSLISLSLSLIMRTQIAKITESYKFSFSAIFSYLKKVKGLTFNLSIIGIFGFVYADLNNVLLSHWLSLKEYANYSVVYNLVILIVLLTSSIKNSFSPEIAEDIKLESNAILIAFSKKMFWMNFFTMPLCLFIIVFSYEILMIWFCDSTIATRLYTSLRYVGMGSMFYSWMILPWSYLIYTTRTRYLIWHTGILALAGIPMLSYLTNSFDTDGASMYWLHINMLPAILMLIYIYFFVFKRFVIHEFIHSMLPLWVPCIIFGLSKLLLNNVLLQFPYYTLSGIFLISYIMILYANKLYRN